MSKFTKGPWKIVQLVMDETDTWTIVANDADESYIAKGKTFYKNSEANARLIAQSPERDAVLKALVHGSQPLSETIRQAAVLLKEIEEGE